MADAPKKRTRDEELVALLVKVILEEGTVASQTRLAQLVNDELPRGRANVGAERLRVLAIRSGLVGVAIRTRTGGATPGTMETCPVCRGKLTRTANRTLHGETTQTGYRCSRCPWWTGRDLRIPQHYVFQAKVSRAEGKKGRNGQLAFIGAQPPRRR